MLRHRAVFGVYDKTSVILRRTPPDPTIPVTLNHYLKFGCSILVVSNNSTIPLNPRDKDLLARLNALCASYNALTVGGDKGMYSVLRGDDSGDTIGQPIGMTAISLNRAHK